MSRRRLDSADCRRTGDCPRARRRAVPLRAAFPIRADEAPLFSPQILRRQECELRSGVTGRVGGTALTGDDLQRLQRLMAASVPRRPKLLDRLLPRYRGRLEQARASFRPAEIAGRDRRGARTIPGSTSTAFRRLPSRAGAFSGCSRTSTRPGVPRVESRRGFRVARRAGSPRRLRSRGRGAAPFAHRAPDQEPASAYDALMLGCTIA